MKRLAVTALAFATLTALPAGAQFYGGGGGGGYYEEEQYEPRRPRRGPPPGFDYGEPDRSYREPRQDYYRGGPRRSVERSSRQRIGSVCVTSRGSCEGPPQPLMSSCRCMIDGFGAKRGAIHY